VTKLISINQKRNSILKSNPNKQQNEKSQTNYLGAGTAIGIGVGLAIGSAMGNTGAGLAIGIALGVGIGAYLQNKNKSEKKE